MTRPLSDRARRTGGWLGIAGPVLYVSTWAVLGATREGFDPVSMAISRLAEIGAGTQPAMSVAFVLFGLATIPFGPALRDVLPGRPQAVAVAAITCGVMTALVAAFPCSPGCPGPAAWNDIGHGITATIGYVALLATPFFAARALRRDAARQPFFWWTAAVVAVAAVVMGWWAAGGFGLAGGAAQRFHNTLLDLWWVTAGVAILRWPPVEPASDDAVTQVTNEPAPEREGHAA